MEFRLATKKDAQGIAEMYLELFRHVYKTSGGNLQRLLKYVQRRLKRRNYFIFVASEDRRIVGTIAVQLHGRTVGSVDDAYVKPTFRRKGVMRGLENNAVQLLKGRGVSTIELSVRVDNEEGMGTWPALGYEPYKILMKKRIQIEKKYHK